MRIREADRDALQFHWIRDKDSSQVETLRLTRALFGLVQSPFLLAGTLKQHLETLRTEYPKHVEEIMKSLYVDDIITGEDTVDQVHELKGTAIRVFERAGFELHKWNSNVPELEVDNQLTEDSQTYAKEQLGVKTNETKLLGLPWDKVKDTLTVTFSGDSHEATKRDVLRSFLLQYMTLWG